ncbi:MAG TPA: hypothetical protein VJV78_09285 [Polyangiales bacterium]|nr:hypothetical protein [Polyangiales bacterium]
MLYRLRQMVIETAHASVGRVCLCGVPGQGDQATSRNRRPNLSGELVPIHDRQPYIHDRDLGLKRRDFAQSLLRLGRDSNVVPRSSEQFRKKLDGVDIVIDQ